MKILCIAEERMNEIYPHMLEAAKRFGPQARISGAQWDDPSYEIITDLFVKVEKQGPTVAKVPAILKDFPDAEILVTCFCPLSEEGLESLPNAKIIGTIRGGYEQIDVAGATKKGIAVFHVPGRNAESVSDFTVALMLAEAREIVRNSMHIMRGEWVDPAVKSHIQPDMVEKTVGLVGMGAIGKLVAKKLGKGFDMKVVAFDPYVSKEEADDLGVTLVNLETLFAISDFVSVHARISEETKGMVTRDLLESMKPTAFFVNTARAILVDNQALYDVLRTKKIAGAALDVLDNEPNIKGNPLLELDNVTITGHLAGQSTDSVAGAPRLLVREMISMIKGESTRGLLNKEILDNPDFIKWLKNIREQLD